MKKDLLFLANNKKNLKRDSKSFLEPVRLEVFFKAKIGSDLDFDLDILIRNVKLLEKKFKRPVVIKVEYNGVMVSINSISKPEKVRLEYQKKLRASPDAKKKKS
jgi:hypothetical protein